jgi:ATP/maltotriose-dependent transcriptional regulator MalT
MLAVPAAIACADFGDLDEAHRHLGIAESSAVRWEGTAWPAAVCEARAHIARAEGDQHEAAALLRRAGQLFRAAGHYGDAARCELKHATATSAISTSAASAVPTITTAGV